MKKVLLAFCLILTLVLPACVFAQTAKVIDLKGQVLVKKDAESEWAKAKIDMVLNKDAEIQTKKKAECVLAFDEELKNILTIKEESLVKLNSITPGEVYLPKGRVFTLIQNLAQAEKFQIKTPVAIAGARATGWGVFFNGLTASISCFEDVVYVQGLDKGGNITKQTDLQEGSGLEVGEGGVFGGAFGLGEGLIKEWNTAREDMGDLRGEEGMDERGGKENRDEMRNEGRDSVRDNIIEDLREKIEDRWKPGGGTIIKP